MLQPYKWGAVTGPRPEEGSAGNTNLSLGKGTAECREVSALVSGFTSSTEITWGHPGGCTGESISQPHAHRFL